jgi:hypothetical protein
VPNSYRSNHRNFGFWNQTIFEIFLYKFLTRFTGHVGLVLIFDESIAPRFAILVLHHYNLQKQRQIRKKMQNKNLLHFPILLELATQFRLGGLVVLQ